MKKVMTAGLALSALFAASGQVPADVNYPWCIFASRTPLAGCKRGRNMHWAEIVLPLRHKQALRLSRRQLLSGCLTTRVVLREAVQLYVGTMHEERILGRRFSTPLSRTLLTLDAM
jgi:hypothetical protein